LPALILVAACASLAHRAFVGPAPLRGRGARVAARGLLDNLDMGNMEKMMSDPKQMEALKKQMDDVMADPAKKKALEDYSVNMQSAVEKLKDDPEMKEFFEDIQKDGLGALKKYESNERVLKKFSEATGGVPGMPPMPGMGAAPAFKPGDQVIISGLSKAPELNGKKAMVVPPTPEEQKTLDGTDRLIVRLVDSGDQFAVRPANLKTTAQEADRLMGNSLEDVSVYNPALQTEAAKLRESGKLEDLQNDPELKPIFEDIKKNGMGALEKYWNDEKLMAKISKAMGSG